MTEYLKKSFTVKTGSRDPKGCEHGWIDAKGRCCFCGAPPEEVKRAIRLRCDGRSP